MENLTLGQIGLAVAFLAALIGGISTLLRQIRTWIDAAFTANVAPLRRDVEQLGERVDEIGKEARKNHIVQAIGQIDAGRQLSDTELERFWEEYEAYRTHGGNSYIAQKVEKLKAEGKL